MDFIVEDEESQPEEWDPCTNSISLQTTLVKRINFSSFLAFILELEKNKRRLPSQVASITLSKHIGDNRQFCQIQNSLESLELEISKERKVWTSSPPANILSTARRW